jgi:methylthioribose-1-phosphate isomerase
LNTFIAVMLTTHVAGDQTLVCARGSGHRCGRGFWRAFRYTEIQRSGQTQILKLFAETCDYLAASRPTAVNLFNMLNEMRKVVSDHPQADVAILKKLLFNRP